MNIDDEHVTALRALVTGDDDAFDRILDNASPEWQDAFAYLLGSVFLAAVKYRFVNTESRPDIIRFVARSRIRHGGDQAGFSPSMAEALMGAAVGINPPPADRSEAEEDENAAAQVALLKDLAGELSYLDFESLLKAAREELSKLDLIGQRNVQASGVDDG
ncbi:MAG: hypothetical protein J2P25_01660 [Nocardiopsaceae bacterium]|nr:hypothetical protein [Nocardiopsaceae bacterium]